MQDLWRLSAAEIAALVRSKKVSAKEAATAALARLDAVNPAINAVVDHRPDDVLAQAAAIDAAIARGENVGPLAGVPVTVKVNIDQQGFANTNGLKLQRDVIAATNNPVIDNLRKAGGVILGRTNCPAFSYRRAARLAGQRPRSLPASGISRMAPISPDRSAIPPMPAAFMACGRRSAASPPSMPRCRSAASGRRSRRSPARWRAASATCGLRWPRCLARTRAIPGGCRRRWKGPRCRSGPRCACSRTVWRRWPK